MKKIFFLTTLNLLYLQVFSQAISSPIMFHAEGAIMIGGTDNPTPDPGTIQYNGADYLGYTEDGWISLTGVPYIYDIDNNRYEIVEIGNQVWMAENLRTTRYNDGTPISLVTDNSAWASRTASAYTWYDNGPTDFGALYNFYTVADTNTRNVCPIGWHIPSSTEWTTLSAFLGGNSVAGGKMKQSGLEYWASPNTSATNESGFNGLPGGDRAGHSGGFFGISDFGGWWSFSYGTSGWVYYYLSYNNALLDTFDADPNRGLSIRCVKD